MIPKSGESAATMPKEPLRHRDREVMRDNGKGTSGWDVAGEAKRFQTPAMYLRVPEKQFVDRVTAPTEDAANR